MPKTPKKADIAKKAASKEAGPSGVVGPMRPPVVAIVGHIDHGKSTLLDYIRHANVVESEAGGITQHLSAYVASHGSHTITFLDTPGHEAFSAMRSRGLSVADVAILVVSAEDGAKPQTLEAVRLIGEAGIPYIVAFTKIDKPDANLERAKNSLLENGIYLEGLGGTVPFIAVSGKSGEGVPELLDLILLAGELEGLTSNEKAPASGVIIEAHIDRKRGTSATLIVKDGTLRSGSYVVAGGAHAPVRIMENFLGKSIKEALPGTPVRIVGFSSLPPVGGAFAAVDSKKEAEEQARIAGQAERLEAQTSLKSSAEGLARGALAEGAAAEEGEVRIILPVVVKTDVAGASDAVLHELKKLPETGRLEARIVSRGVGAISEADVRLVGSGEHPGIILGFNVSVDAPAQTLADRLNVKIVSFDIIYKLTEWLAKELEERRPRERVEEKTGSAKVLKLFSTMKRSIVLGGKVEEGSLGKGDEVRIMRRDLELGTGKIESLQSQKKDVGSVEAGHEFGAIIRTDAPVAAGDHLESFTIAYK